MRESTRTRSFPNSLPFSREEMNQIVAEAMEKAKRAKERENSPYRKFQRTYRNDPAAFVHDCFYFGEGGGPTAYQTEILEAIIPEKRVSVRGPHGLGKTTLGSWIVLWFSLTRDGEDDWKLPTLASAWRQLTKYLWPEVKKWRSKLKWNLVGRDPFSDRLEALALSLKLDTGEAFALASDDHETIEGAHATSLLYLFDESKIIPDASWDAAEGAFASPDTGEAMAIAVSTPGAPSGRFYDIHSRQPGYEDWWVRHVSLEEAIEAGRISRIWAEQRKRQWGEDSAVYQNRVLGEFAVSEEAGVIALAWVEKAAQRWEEWNDAGRPDTWPLPTDEEELAEISRAAPNKIGVDVARYGEDETAIVLAHDNKIIEIRRYSKADTMETVGRVSGLITKHPGIKTVVDVIGVGAGVVDRLRELHGDIFAFGAGEKTDRRDKSGEMGFVDKRSASWWALRELMEEGRVLLPNDDKLTGELTAPMWRMMSGNKVKVESKRELRTRLNRSTDTADGVIMALVGLEFAETWLIW